MQYDNNNSLSTLTTGIITLLSRDKIVVFEYYDCRRAEREGIDCNIKYYHRGLNTGARFYLTYIIMTIFIHDKLPT